MNRSLRAALLASLLSLAVPAGAAGPKLPEALPPEEAVKLLAKPPAGLDLIDIRTPAEFQDYALPGALNLDAAAVLADETLLTGSGPLVLVDKDGTAAFAVAGALAARASRPVLALRGGMAAWWTTKELGVAVREVPLGDAPAAAPAVQTPPAAPAPAGPAPSDPTPPVPSPSGPAPQPPASKNAGC
ncbi:hypothetical protein NNJEOMEG_02567 [Fundidesulfovibrio magnetotacticus]|uniref:Rhodanese domain-containing protein n=1 Tax=Fundidesulfovibrio magnetotacticus TaxID=2730080 RepID=A0A6V8LUT9_9BACT|nr:rhodanese-like domain-containing protein [Fundidesulfovibrio magnetotacticus]GFK94720.1 hypothetical protein NNJEOMEG_02567 [Fundidesulfovibrio magnetotacticus]